MFTPDEIRAREREADGEADEGTSAPEDCLHGTPGCACYQSGYGAGSEVINVRPWKPGDAVVHSRDRTAFLLWYSSELDTEFTQFNWDAHREAERFRMAARHESSLLN